MSRPTSAAASRDAHLTLRRVERHQRLIELLGAERRPWSAPELARRLGVAVRTVERDLERLRQTGLPLVSRPGRGGGVRLDAARGVRTVQLDAAEIAALLASLTALGPTATAVASSATRALVTALTAPTGSGRTAPPAPGDAPGSG